MNPTAEIREITADMSEKELLLQMAQDARITAQNSQKQLRLARIRLVLLVLFLAAALIFAAPWTPKIEATLEKTDLLLDDLAQVTEQIESADIPGLMESMDQLAEEGVLSLQSIREAAETLGDLNMEKLNQAISDLQKAISPLARLFG